MSSRMLVVFLIFVLSLPLLSSAEDGGNGYWERLKNKLAHISPQKKGAATTAVGGIRGSKDQSGDTLYWKGEEEIVAEDEYARFQEAYQSAAAGKKEEATAGFETFLKDFPQSPLCEDARLALKELQQP